MNKSLEFVKKRLKEMGMNWDYKDEDVDIHSSESVFRRILKDFGTGGLSFGDAFVMCYQLMLSNGEKIDVEVTVANDDFDNFDFFNAHSEHNDGTQLFTCQAIDEVFFEAMTCKVWPKTKISSISDLDGVQKINITLGDVIVCQKEDTSPDPERLWMTNKLEVFLPAYFELVK